MFSFLYDPISICISDEGHCALGEKESKNHSICISFFFLTLFISIAYFGLDHFIDVSYFWISLYSLDINPPSDI